MEAIITTCIRPNADYGKFYEIEKMKSLGIFSWLYDAVPEREGIHFVRFGVFKTHEIPYQDIEEVIEVGRWRRAPLMSLDFQNRLFTKTFLVKAKHGLLWRNVLMTPKDADGFRSLLRARGILVKPQGSGLNL